MNTSLFFLLSKGQDTSIAKGLTETISFACIKFHWLPDLCGSFEGIRFKYVSIHPCFSCYQRGNTPVKQKGLLETSFACIKFHWL